MKSHEVVRRGDDPGDGGPGVVRMEIERIDGEPACYAEAIADTAPPNFIVKTIAAGARVPTPSLFGYMLNSEAILLPPSLSSPPFRTLPPRGC